MKCRPFQWNGLQESLAEFRAAHGAKSNEIVFPAACTSEKHSARSERRIARRRRATEAQSGANLLSPEKAQPFQVIYTPRIHVANRK